MRSAGRVGLAAVWVALALAGLRPVSARAEDQPDTLTFRSLPELLQPRTEPSYLARHRAPILIVGAAATVGSLVGSQLLLRAADRRYSQYQSAVNPADIANLYQEARARDRWSNALVVTGELAAAATLFVAWHSPDDTGARLSVGPLPRHGGGLALQLAWNSP